MAWSLTDRLAALEHATGRQSSLGGGQGDLPAAGEDNPSRTHPGSGGEGGVAGLDDLGFRRLPNGVWHREMRYDLLTRHGEGRFADLLTSPLEVLAKAVHWSKEVAVGVENLRFYDTETSGLGSGAGTFPFLHAVAQVDGDELVLYQYLLSDYGEEVNLLTTLAQIHFTPNTGVVSFNGKSYDWPLLQNRLRLHRLPDLKILQMDLLHPARRMWRHVLEKVSLEQVERHMLGVLRQEDLPSREAPQRYFAFLDDGDARILAPVLSHNALDVCSLVVLTARLATLLAGTRLPVYAHEYVGVASYYDEWRETELADSCLQAAVNCPDADWRVHWLHSLRAKRAGQWDQAAVLWSEMMIRYRWSVAPCVELAKFAEHRSKDLVAAREWARTALHRAITNPTNGSNAEVLQQLRHRLARIERKLSGLTGINAKQ